jgi:hypothetical protein
VDPGCGSGEGCELPPEKEPEPGSWRPDRYGDVDPLISQSQPPTPTTFIGNNEYGESIEAGGLPGIQPYGSQSYASMAEESTCNEGGTGCPSIPFGYGMLPGAVDVVNGYMIGNIAGHYVNDPRVIRVFMNYDEYNNGTIVLHSLTVRNYSNNSVDVRLVTIIPKITNATVPAGYPPMYVVSPPRISRPGDNSISGPLSSGMDSVVRLIPSGNSVNPNNQFPSNYSLTVRVVIGIYGGNAWPPITFNLNRP